MCLLLAALKPDLSRLLLIPRSSAPSPFRVSPGPSGADAHGECDIRLHIAAWQDDKEKAQLLLAKGADANAQACALTAVGIECGPGHFGLRRAGGSAGEGGGFPVAQETGADEAAPLALPVPPTFERLAAFSLTLSYPALFYATEIRALTPLHLAAMYGARGTAELLLSQGADVNAKTTVLSVWRMLESNTPVDPESASGFTSLHLAVANGAAEIVELLLARQADPNAPIEQTLLTPLHLAAASGRKDIVELLLLHGAQVNAKALYGKTPLHFAAEWGHKDMAEFLLARGADPDAPLCIAGAIILYAVETGSPRFQGSDQSGSTPLHLAAREGHNDLARLLLEKGADADAKTKVDKMPLHLAIEDGRGETVELLLAGGAMINAKDRRGRTPLHYAVEKGHTRIVELLLAGKALVNDRDGSGRTPLDLAKQIGNADIARILARTGGKRGKTLLRRCFRLA